MPNTPSLRIAIDGNEANITNRVGSNVYAFEIIVALEKITRKRADIEVTVLLGGPKVKDLPKTRPGWKYQQIKPAKLLTQIGLPIHLYLHKHDYNVFFTPGHYAPRHSSVPYVSTIMDLAFLKYPQQFRRKDFLQLKNWTEYSVKHARKVIAISEYTKEDVQNIYGRLPEDVVVAYPAISENLKEVTGNKVSSVMHSFGLEKPYILYVGTLQPRKNLLKLIEAFERVQRVITNSNREVKLRSKYELRRVNAFRSIQLVIAGKIGWLADDILDRVKNSPMANHIVLTDYVDEETKTALYQGAELSTLVGLYEGFGIPPLESLAHGTIPVVSNTTSLPEVVGEAGITVDPNSVTSIANGLLVGLLLSAKERARLRREGRKQLQQFSWETSAQHILTALEDVAQQSRH